MCALGADPAVKPGEPPPVIPAGQEGNQGAVATPGATDPQAGSNDQPPLPDNLPVLLEPGRPELIPRRPPSRPRKIQAIMPLVPLTEEEVGGVPEATDALPSFLEMVEPVREPNVAEYTLDDPLARTTLSNIFSNAERFYDGFGGIIRPFDVLTLPRAPFDAGRGVRMGALSFRPGLSGALIGTRRGGGGTRSDEPSAVIAGTISGLIGTPETGRYLRLDYGIAKTFENEQAEDFHFDQSLYLAGHLRFGNLSLGLGINFANLSGFNRDAGSDLQRDYLTVAFTSRYQLTPRTSIDWDIATPNGRYPSGSSGGGSIGDSSGFTSTNFVNYEYSGKSTVGLGFAAGFVEVQDADTQKFERVLARIGSTPTAFLSYSATFGLEFRDTGQSNQTNPMFSLGAVWTPRDRTAVTLTGEQRVQNSVSTANANFVSTSLVLSLSQRLGDRFTASCSIGFENAKYESLGSEESSNRRDRTYLGQVSFGTTLFDRMDVSTSFSYVRTDSRGSTTYTAQCVLQASIVF